MTYQELLAENQQPHQSITGYKEGQETLKKETASLKGQLAQLYKLINGFKSERFVTEVASEQLSLFSEGGIAEVMEAPQKKPSPIPARRKSTRAAMPYRDAFRCVRWS